MSSKPMQLFGVLAVSLLLGACAGDGAVAPSDASLRSQTAFNGAGESDVTLCKFGPVGSWATFEISATAGSLLTASTLTIQADPSDPQKACILVWRPGAAGLTGTFTATEVGMSPGVELQVIRAWSIDGDHEFYPPVNSVTVNVTSTDGALITFKNTPSDVPPPPPNGGGQGCTPGYWKQSQHFSSWTAPYSPSTQFSAVFEDAFPGKTLLQVLGQGGGGLNALGRHTVAALLNSASGSVSYDMTTAGVITAFNDVFPGGDYEARKNIFAEFNEQGCSIPK